MKYEFTMKETIEHYKEKGIEDIKICIGDPLTGMIKWELKDIELEKFDELVIGRYQAQIKTNEKQQKTLVVTLILPQAKTIYENVSEHYAETYFESDIVNEYTMFDSTKTAMTRPPVGYCHYIAHPGYMTRKMMEQHSCLCKDGGVCPHLEKFNTHMYWTQKNLKKERKKQRLGK